MRRSEMDDGNVALGLFVAGPLTFAVAGLLGLARDHVTQANVVLVLVLMVVAAAALGGRLAGVAGAVCAALSFNFFHTQPYLSLRIHDAGDVLLTLLLLVVGLAVGELALLRERWRLGAGRSAREAAELEALSDLVARGAPVADVWAAARAALCRALALEGCRYEPFGIEARPLPRITRSAPVPGQGHLVADARGFVLPASGAELVVRDRGLPVGRIVVTPVETRGVRVHERLFAVAVADLVGVAVSGQAVPALD